MAKKKILYAAQVSTSGLYSDKPVELEYIEQFRAYIDLSATPIDGLHICIDEIDGYDVQDNIVTFSSFSKKEVENFLLGVDAVYSILRTVTQIQE